MDVDTEFVVLVTLWTVGVIALLGIGTRYSTHEGPGQRMYRQCLQDGHKDYECYNILKGIR